MFLVMTVGMMVLGGLDSGVLAAFGTRVSHVPDAAPAAFALVMALNMTVGMTLWMRYRRRARSTHESAPGHRRIGDSGGQRSLPARGARASTYALARRSATERAGCIVRVPSG